MKQTLIVFRDKESGAFLAEYKNNKGSLAFTAKYTEDIEDAATIPPKRFEEERERYERMLQLFNAEPLKVEYKLTTLDGKEPEEIKMTTFNDPTDLIATLRNLEEIFAGGDD